MYFYVPIMQKGIFARSLSFIFIIEHIIILQQILQNTVI